MLTALFEFFAFMAVVVSALLAVLVAAGVIAAGAFWATFAWPFMRHYVRTNVRIAWRGLKARL